jgi:hypothetical protein
MVAREAESQETYPRWSKLTLFARKSVAMSLAILARLFVFVARFLTGVDCGAVGDVRFFRARRFAA